MNTTTNNNICEVSEAFWVYKDDELIFTVTANRFLHNMVRAIVGTLLWVGKGKISVDDFQNIINKQDRCRAGMSAPAHALFLHEIKYKEL